MDCPGPEPAIPGSEQPVPGPQQPIFYYDLGSPDCYLLAEQISSGLGQAPEWEPVLGSDIAAVDPHPDRAWFEQRAVELGLLPLRWPPTWPPESRVAMLAATYAKRIGRPVAFSLAAFRQVFAGGRDLGDEDTVLIAAAACEMHPAAILKALALQSISDALGAATRRANSAGVRSLPAIQLGGALFEGDQALQNAARALAQAQ